MILLALLILSSPLDDGITERQNGNNQAAIQHFEETLSSDRVNSMGKAIAYWNLYDIYVRDPKTYEKSGDYLLGFIVNAEEIIEISKQDPQGYWGIFVKSNDLTGQLNFAKEKLDEMWNKRK